jgi:hypothetical protein
MGMLCYNESMKWNKETIIDLLEKSDKAVWRAVYRIYENQTEYERVAEATQENNGIGFNGNDAAILTSYAKFYKERGFLTKNQTAVARKKIKKYHRQLLDVIKG